MAVPLRSNFNSLTQPPSLSGALREFVPAAFGKLVDPPVSLAESDAAL
jgi:hypothetical protein